MTDASKARPVVMISSTARDLPEHREQVRDACLRQGMFPSMMEHLPASDAEAIAASLKLVDEADIYVGVFAHRYGYVPEGHDISITEMEYNRAVERKIPRLIFLIDKKQSLAGFTIADIDTGESADKLARFKGRVEAENIVNYFKSPADLRADVINSLSQHRQPDLTTFHYVSDIPEPPEPFIAHPYTLLQTHRLVGRQPELNLLTDWVARPDSDIYRARILNVVSVGGLGKSALTWKWFNDIAPQEMRPLAGRLWWSFYESDATFENFVTRALAYVTRRPLAEVQQIPAPDRESQLLAALDREPFLLVLDGLERILIAYARMDAARLEDSQVGSQRNLRKTADPRAGRFLKKLAQVRASRILASTRLYPAELETFGGDPIPGSFRRDLTGLSDEEAVELWRALKVPGARDLLLPVFNTIGKHPLLIQALAGEVKRFRRAPGDFAEWRKVNPRFDPARFRAIQDAMSHVMEYALSGLDERVLQVLQMVAAFRMPAGYDTLAALLVSEYNAWPAVMLGENKLLRCEHELDEILTELEDRGLVGWDKRANRYDLHPVVRGVVWSGLHKDTRHGVYESLYEYFEILVVTEIDFININTLDGVLPAVELFNSLIELRKYEQALDLFRYRLFHVLYHHLCANHLMVELLSMFFPEGLEKAPCLRDEYYQGVALNALALGYQGSGQPGQAVPLFRRANERYPFELFGEITSTWINLSYATRLSGALFESEAAARRVLFKTQKSRVDREFVALEMLGLTLAARGMRNESESAFERTVWIQAERPDRAGESFTMFHRAQSVLWMGEFDAALSLANRAWELAQGMNTAADFIRAARVQGEAALGLSDFVTADEWLHHALTRARAVNLVEEELPALVALAERQRRRGDLKAARELLDEVWEAAERGPYPLIHADACNVLSQVERDAGDKRAAVKAATKAYELAWCDGPPFAYHWGLEKARALLRELGAGEPELPPFDGSKFEPMPEVEIDPADEFGSERKSVKPKKRRTGSKKRKK